MEWILVLVYWWAATMFGWWYWYPTIKKDWDCYEKEFTAAVMSFIVTPAFLPLVVSYVYRDAKKKEREELRKLSGQ